MWWKKKPVPEKPLRQQLLEARANVAHQLLIMQTGPLTVGGRGPSLTPVFQRSAAELSETLRQIDESLANLRADDA
jgi:hypothetical protein